MKNIPPQWFYALTENYRKISEITKEEGTAEFLRGRLLPPWPEIGELETAEVWAESTIKTIKTG